MELARLKGVLMIVVAIGIVALNVTLYRTAWVTHEGAKGDQGTRGVVTHAWSASNPRGSRSCKGVFRADGATSSVTVAVSDAMCEDEHSQDGAGPKPGRLVHPLPTFMKPGRVVAPGSTEWKGWVQGGLVSSLLLVIPVWHLYRWRRLRTREPRLV